METKNEKKASEEETKKIRKSALLEKEIIEKNSESLQNLLDIAFPSQALLRSLEQQHRMLTSMTRAVLISRGMLNNLGVIDMIKRVHAFNDQIKSLLSVSEKIAEMVRPIRIPSFDYGFILESLKFQSEEEWKKFEYKWLGFLTWGEMITLYKKWKEGKCEEVKKYFREQFDSKEKIDELISRLEKKDALKERIKIIKDALHAHADGKYTLSIPVLYTQIDGLFIDNYKGILKGKMNTCPVCRNPYPVQCNAKQICKEMLKEDNKVNSIFLDDFLKHIEQEYEPRSGVLHGTKLDYDDSDTSTKLILALLELVEHLS